MTKHLKLVLHSLKVSVPVPDSGSLNSFSVELHESSLKVSKGGIIICAFLVCMTWADNLNNSVFWHCFWL